MRSENMKFVPPGPGEWTFEDGRVASAFDRHVREQLPWYDLATGAVAHICRHYIPDGGLVYDIGASTGNIGRAIEKTLEQRRARLVAIEPSKAMRDMYVGPGTVVGADATEYEYDDFDVAVCFLVLMFIPVAKRKELIDMLYKKCRPGGAIIVFDKLEPEHGYLSVVMWRLALAGKVAAGVDTDEIVAKELSLSGVQRPIDPAILGPKARQFFRFGDFAGWVIEK